MEQEDERYLQSRFDLINQEIKTIRGLIESSNKVTETLEKTIQLNQDKREASMKECVRNREEILGFIADLTRRIAILEHQGQTTSAIYGGIVAAIISIAARLIFGAN